MTAPPALPRRLDTYGRRFDVTCTRGVGLARFGLPNHGGRTLRAQIRDVRRSGPHLWVAARGAIRVIVGSRRDEGGKCSNFKRSVNRNAGKSLVAPDLPSRQTAVETSRENPSLSSRSDANNNVVKLVCTARDPVLYYYDLIMYFRISNFPIVQPKQVMSYNMFVVHIT